MGLPRHAIPQSRGVRTALTLQEAEAILCDGDAYTTHFCETETLEALNGNPIKFAGVKFAVSQVL